MTFQEKVVAVQSELKAPKGQYNSFGKYNYRSCEDILEGVKPLLNKYGLYLKISDAVELIGDRYYIKATATLSDADNCISTSAYARESLDKKGMDSSQVTGATSSYARKYALNGLFAIDDNKDADSVEDKPLPQNTAYNWKTLKTRATQGGVTEEALKDYLKNELKVKNTDEMTRDHYQKAFDWVNSQRYKR
ncbi:MAG: ERF family protein [Solobacterium sp.]|nr:ERF family protein [Solobacterium sp.]